MSEDDPGKARLQPAFVIEVLDTNGCGDVFHGAYAACLAQGMRASERIRFASATAAIKATHGGGQKGIPLRAAVEEFLESRSGEALIREA